MKYGNDNQGYHGYDPLSDPTCQSLPSVEKSTSSSRSSEILTTFVKEARNLKEQWPQTRQEVIADLRNVKWIHIGGWALFLGWVIVILTLGIILPIRHAVGARWDFEWTTGTQTLGDSPCQPNGSFNLDGTTSLWKLGFFDITLAFGHLTFTQAKVIDIVWDVGVGRIGQALMAYYSWKAFAAYVTTSMASGPITYRTFAALFINHEPSLLNMCRVTRDFTTKRGLLQSRVAMVFIIFSIAFTLAFPTLVSAMTGYTPLLNPFVPDPSGNLIQLSILTPTAYMIHDGWRVNLTGNYAVSYWEDNKNYVNTYAPMTSFNTYRDLCLRLDIDDTGKLKPSDDETYEIPMFCQIQRNVSIYVATYGFLGLNQTKSVFMGKELESPTLNISAFYIQGESSRVGDLYGYNWTDPRDGKPPFQNSANLHFSALNESYSLDTIKQRGTCQPDNSGTFQWGFSFIQLFVMCVVLFIWMIGIFIMWFTAHFTLIVMGNPDVPHSFRAVLDLATAIREQFTILGKDPFELDSGQLKAHVTTELRGGKVQNRTEFEATTYSFRRGVWEFLKQEKWWSIGMLGYTTFCVTVMTISTTGGHDYRNVFSHSSDALAMYTLLSLSWTGVLLAWRAGSTRRSQWFLLTCALALGVPMCLAWVVTLAEWDRRNFKARLPYRS